MPEIDYGHDRLLERIDELDTQMCLRGAADPDAALYQKMPLTDAVLAVAELHKPEFFGGRNACLACSPGMPPPLLIEYPCPTISSVAAALGVELDA